MIAIIGDGGMTGGLAYEGINNLGYHKTQLTVVLNDNSLSISKSVGALSKYLTLITTNSAYNRFRKDVWKYSGKIPFLSKLIRKLLKKTERGCPLLKVNSNSREFSSNMPFPRINR